MPVPEFIAPFALSPFRKRLLAWFDRNRRNLPWRSDRDPYRVWVSEVMLQQTTVAAVVPYFERFVAAFPTVEALAAADEQAVLKLWAGLGYYRRARHLHAAARRLVTEHGGRLPDDPQVWKDLPGVGRYILGAVLSQAFDRRLPIVEANSLRLLARLYGFRGDPRTGDGKRWVWEAAEAVLPKKRAGDFNQALMELGALVCKPERPRCESCPVSRACLANRLGLQSAIPPPPAAEDVVRQREVGLVIRDRGRVLLGRRPANAARWANMWEFPHGELRPGEVVEEAAVRVARELTGLRIALGTELMTVRHTVTRFRITSTYFEAARAGGRVSSPGFAETTWARPESLREFPVGTVQETLIVELTRTARQRRLF
jgi:A/G-specific adenine glycosylase